MKSIKTTSMVLALMLLMSPVVCSAMDQQEKNWFKRKANEGIEALRRMGEKGKREYKDWKKTRKGNEDTPAVETPEATEAPKVETPVVETPKVETTWLNKIRDWSKDRVTAGYDSVKDGFNSGIITIQENPKTSIAVGLGIAALIGVSYVIYKKLTEKTEKTEKTDDQQA